MRRLSIILILLLVLASALVTAGCGSGKSGAVPGVDDPSPEQILSDTFSTSYDLTAVAGSFDVTVTVDADKGQIPAGDMPFAGALVDNGLSFSGDFAVSNEPLAVDFSISGQLMGQSLDLGMRLKDDACWILYEELWYEMPAETLAMMDDYSSQVDPEEVARLLEDLGLDPVTWIKNLELVGEEVIAGAPTLHLAGSPDVMKMITDAFELMQSEEFLALIDPTGAVMPGMGGPGFLPSVAEIEDMRTMVESMFRGVKLDLWVGKDDSMLRKMVVTGHIAPPPGVDADGFLGMDFSAGMTLDTVGQPVTVEPPAAPLPFTELEQTVMETPGLFQMFMGGAGMNGYGGPQTRF